MNDGGLLNRPHAKRGRVEPRGYAMIQKNCQARDNLAGRTRQAKRDTDLCPRDGDTDQCGDLGMPRAAQDIVRIAPGEVGRERPTDTVRRRCRGVFEPGRARDAPAGLVVEERRPSDQALDSGQLGTLGGMPTRTQGQIHAMLVDAVGPGAKSVVDAGAAAVSGDLP
jgi:hypothetical protein